MQVIKHAFVPAVISYIALVYIVHLEALKKDMKSLGEGSSLGRMALNFAARARGDSLNALIARMVEDVTQVQAAA